MNFEPPDSTKDMTFGGSGLYQNASGSSAYSNLQFSIKPDSSPLLRDPSPTKNYDINGQSNPRNNSKGRYKAPLYNRLGNRNFQNRNNNVLNSAPVNNGNTGQRNFNRKRGGDSNTGPVLPKRMWSNKPFYPNTNNQQNHNSVQNRLDRIRNSNSSFSMLEEKTCTYKDEPDSVNSDGKYFSDPQEQDPADITVEVINNTARLPQGDDQNNLIRFKMVLDAKAQNAIRLLQQKRKDKQVIFPFPVTPNVTGVSLHDRFSQL